VINLLQKNYGGPLTSKKEMSVALSKKKGAQLPIPALIYGLTTYIYLLSVFCKPQMKLCKILNRFYI